MFYSEDFKGKPVDFDGLSGLLQSNPEVYQNLMLSCSLAILGISETDRNIAKTSLESYMGPGFEIAVKKGLGALSVFGTNDEIDLWQYFMDIPDYYRTFLHKERGINFVCIN
jgi:hypothetical protein